MLFRSPGGEGQTIYQMWMELRDRVQANTGDLGENPDAGWYDDDEDEGEGESGEDWARRMDKEEVAALKETRRKRF